MKYLRFHELRHTFGTLAVRVFPLTDVKAYMGHADVQTTMLYVHHVPQHDAAAKLSAALRAESTPNELTPPRRRTPESGERLVDVATHKPDVLADPHAR